jgi:hypothetical protein
MVRVAQYDLSGRKIRNHDSYSSAARYMEVTRGSILPLSIQQYVKDIDGNCYKYVLFSLYLE